jgi:hypothetical protein
MVKVTFTLDDVTVKRLREAAARLARPHSQVVREAIREYAERVGRLSETERIRLLHAFDTLVPQIPARPVAEVDAEIRRVREARRRGGRGRGTR